MLNASKGPFHKIIGESNELKTWLETPHFVYMFYTACKGNHLLSIFLYFFLKTI